MIVSQRLRIQTALVELAKEGEFYAVRYDDKTKLPVAPDDTSRVDPLTCYANESGISRIVPDPRQGREEVRKREGWPFELRLTFGGEVLLDRFVESLLKPPILPAKEGLRQVTLRLTAVQATHPIQQPQTGTSAVLHFTADEGRQ